MSGAVHAVGKVFKAVGHAVSVLWHNPIVKAIVIAAAIYFTAGAASAYFGASGAAVAGGTEVAAGATTADVGASLTAEISAQATADGITATGAAAGSAATGAVAGDVGAGLTSEIGAQATADGITASGEAAGSLGGTAAGDAATSGIVNGAASATGDVGADLTSQIGAQATQDGITATGDAAGSVGDAGSALGDVPAGPSVSAPQAPDISNLDVPGVNAPNVATPTVGSNGGIVNNALNYVKGLDPATKTMLGQGVGGLAKGAFGAYASNLDRQQQLAIIQQQRSDMIRRGYVPDIRSWVPGYQSSSSGLINNNAQSTAPTAPANKGPGQ